MISNSIQPTECLAKITIEDHCEHPRVLQNIQLEITHPSQGKIGSLHAIRIIRHNFRGHFLEVLDEESDELHQFSVELFDKYGKVRPWLIDTGHRSGTGCWGRELNSGQLIYLLDMNVDGSMQGKGIGSWALKQLMASDHVQQDDIVICWPSPVGSTDKEQWDAQRARQVAFFRKNDFRRIGRTSFFGYSPNPGHPSRNIPITSDADPVDQGFSSTDPQLTMEERSVECPLHFSIANTKTEGITNTIQGFHRHDPSSIHKTDENGFTPIFVAAGSVNVFAVRKLIDLGVREDLESYANRDGLTPLEQLDKTMRSDREFAETMLGLWDGYSDDQLAVEFLLKQSMGKADGEGNEAEYVAKRRWGCTCGACAGGWLSARMRFRLKCQAALMKDGMSMNESLFQPRQPLSAIDAEIDETLSFLPLHLRGTIFKTFYKGYEAVYNCIYAFFGIPNSIPTVQAISAAIHDLDARYYFGKGGKIEYALDGVTHYALEQSQLGDGEFENLWEDEEQVGDDYTKLVECANDLEFRLVRRMMGLDPRLEWGPYSDDGGERGDDDGDFGNGMDIEDDARLLLQFLNQT